MKIVILSLLLAGCSIDHKPRFKKGDCVSDRNNLEFKWLYKPHLRRILEVGKENYLYTYYSIKNELPITVIDKFSYRVSSSECEKLGY